MYKKQRNLEALNPLMGKGALFESEQPKTKNRKERKKSKRDLKDYTKH